MTLCELGAPPHERVGFEVKGPRRWLSPAQALRFDLAAIDAASRHRREETRKEVLKDERNGSPGINTIVMLLRKLTRQG